jgi:hypothetical protein
MSVKREEMLMVFDNTMLFKEVLRRENQGLKVYSIDGSSVFSMTGTYF